MKVPTVQAVSKNARCATKIAAATNMFLLLILHIKTRDTVLSISIYATLYFLIHCSYLLLWMQFLQDDSQDDYAYLFCTD